MGVVEEKGADTGSEALSGNHEAESDPSAEESKPAKEQKVYDITDADSEEADRGSLEKL